MTSSVGPPYFSFGLFQQRQSALSAMETAVQNGDISTALQDLST